MNSSLPISLKRKVFNSCALPIRTYEIKPRTTQLNGSGSKRELISPWSKWAEHVIRRQDKRWSLRVMDWIPRKARVREKVRWADEIGKFAEIQWLQLASEADRSVSPTVTRMVETISLAMGIVRLTVMIACIFLCMACTPSDGRFEGRRSSATPPFHFDSVLV